MLFGRHYISTMGYSQVMILIIFLTLKPYISLMSHPIKTIQCASLQENLTMTFSSYLHRTKLFWKAVSQRFRDLPLIATFSVLMMRVASPIWIHLIFPCYHKIVNSLYQIHQKWLTWNVLYQMFCHKNPDPSNLFHQIRNQTCFSQFSSQRMCPPQNIPFLDLCSKHQSWQCTEHTSAQHQAGDWLWEGQSGWRQQARLTKPPITPTNQESFIWPNKHKGTE